MGSFSRGFMCSYYSKTRRSKTQCFRGPNSTQINFETDKQKISQNIQCEEKEKIDPKEHIS